MNKKIFKKLAVGTLAAGLTLTSAACGNDGGSSADGRTEITVLFGKTEVINQFEAMVEDFNNSQDEIHVTNLPLGQGQGVVESAGILYTQGDAATILHLPPEFMHEFEDKLLDLSGEPFEELAMEGTLDFVKRSDGRLLGMPATVEGFGFIYNKAAIEEALGEEFHSEDIRTIDALEELFIKLEEAEGIDPIHVSPIGWSIGRHFPNVFLAGQSEDYQGNVEFVEDLIAGNVDLADNEVYQGWLETFQLMTRFNTNKNAPLDPNYDDGMMDLADGNVGLWFMGDWAYVSLSEINPDGEYGFMPVPISNNPDDFGNNSLSIDVPQFWSIDAEQSTEEEQEAAKEFLNWMISSETGQQHFVNELNLMPIFKNMDLRPEGSLSLSMMDFLENEDTMPWIINGISPTIIDEVSEPLLRYMTGDIDIDEVTETIQSFFRSLDQ